MVNRKFVYWLSPVPSTCQTCSSPITNKFYDARVACRSQWAIMCPSCFHLGPGVGILGAGQGQEYELQTNDKFLKVGG